MEQHYLSLLNEVKSEGFLEKNERTGVNSLKLFGPQYRCKNVGKNFPLITTKDVHFRSIVIELLWKISGSTNIQPLVKQKVRIWNEWPFQSWLKKKGIENKYPKYSESWKKKMEWFVEKIKFDDSFAARFGGLGPTYGHHFVNFGGFQKPTNWLLKRVRNMLRFLGVLKHQVSTNQLERAIDLIKNNPGSRRIIITLWNPNDNPHTLLPPCPCFYQFFVAGDTLHLKMYQRSADLFLGVPFNTAQDALLLMLVAQVCGLKAGDLIHTFGDTHIYTNHLTAVETQLSRQPRKVPRVVLNPEIMDINKFTPKDIKLEGYNPHPKIKAQVAV